MSDKRSFTVLVDTREKNPWDLNSSRVISKEYLKLDTGDYTVSGLENKLCIDRKSSVAEIANNISQKRFVDELERIRAFPHAFIIIEATADDVFRFPDTADLPPSIKKRIKVSGGYIMRCLSRMQIKYNFNVIFAGSRDYAERIAVNLMEDVLNIYE